MEIYDFALEINKMGSFQMFTQYFGNYLFESNIISLEQFRKALQQIKDKRAKLGVLAIESGNMTPTQVEETFSMQKQVDKRFGEIAVEKGYLTEEQLEKLLKKQTSPFSVFSQIMIENGCMTYAQLAEHLANYKKKCGLSDENFTKFQDGDLSPIIQKLVPEQAGNPQRDVIVRSYIEVFMKSMMRFINENVTIGEACKPVWDEGSWFSCQRLTGTQNFVASFSGSEAAMRYIASKFAKEEYTGFGVLVKDVLGEFMNCNDGIFTANALESGIDLNLDPQYVTNDSKEIQTGTLFNVHFSVDNYHYQLTLAFQS